jgi:hypothetical protein
MLSLRKNRPEPAGRFYPFRGMRNTPLPAPLSALASDEESGACPCGSPFPARSWRGGTCSRAIREHVRSRNGELAAPVLGCPAPARRGRTGVAIPGLPSLFQSSGQAPGPRTRPRRGLRRGKRGPGRGLDTARLSLWPFIFPRGFNPPSPGRPVPASARGCRNPRK